MRAADDDITPELAEFLLRVQDELEYTGVELLGRQPDWSNDWAEGRTPLEAVRRFEQRLAEENRMDEGMGRSWGE